MHPLPILTNAIDMKAAVDFKPFLYADDLVLSTSYIENTLRQEMSKVVHGRWTINFIYIWKKGCLFLSALNNKLAQTRLLIVTKLDQCKNNIKGYLWLRSMIMNWLCMQFVPLCLFFHRYKMICYIFLVSIKLPVWVQENSLRWLSTNKSRA